MGVLSFVFSHDSIFSSVKQETSLFAERRFSEDGETLFEQLVFDEEYLIKFRELFFDAQAEMTPILSTYMRDVPVDYECFETQDFSNDRDYIFNLLMPWDWNYHLQKPLDIKIKEFLVAYICYRWFETKIPETAVVYLQRADALLEDIKNLLDRRTGPVRRAHGFYELGI
jgi:hypothetical protein